MESTTRKGTIGGKLVNIMGEEIKQNVNKQPKYLLENVARTSEILKDPLK